MYSIDKNVESTIFNKKSKFITRIYSVNSVEETNELLDKVRKEFKDATHICYGYIINNLEKCSDDGEPSNTAGLPILNALRKKNLTNVLAIVIRYFGGIKLGVGGLTRAYKNAVTDSLKLTNIIELTAGYLIEFEFPYEQKKLIDYILINKDIINKSYDNNIIYEFYLSEEESSIISELEKVAIHLSIKEKILIKKN